MKLLKIAIALFAATLPCVSTPAFAETITESQSIGVGQITATNKQIRYECLKFISHGFKSTDLIVNQACALRGVDVMDRINMHPNNVDQTNELLINALVVRDACTRLSEGSGSDSYDTISLCASVGVGVDNTNLD